MKLIEKIKAFFTCSKEFSTITLRNGLVQEDLYEFLNTDESNGHGYKITMSSAPNDNKFQLIRCIDEDTVMYYPYENREDLKNDFEEIKRAIKKLNK